MNKSNILENLNPEQQKAVTNTEGPLLILAGAGSGKTRVLTHRMAYLIQECGIKPDSILAVTFTNKAAAEMKQRTLLLLSKKTLGKAEPVISTFHSLGLRILRKEAHHLNYNHDFIIYDSDDQKKIIKESLKELDVSEKIYNVNAILSRISSAKSNFVSPTDYAQSAKEQFEFQVAHIYPLYQKFLHQNQAMDFDDLIILTVKLFEKNPSVLKKYQQQFNYFLVDEYQDTNHSQYRLTNLLAKASKKLCVVGDDDQSIYSWRGADIQNILDFESDYHDTQVIKLEQNYRSTKRILKAADEVIRLNVQRKAKTLWTENEEGEIIRYYEAFNEHEEARFIIDEISNLCHEKQLFEYRDTAILYRTNAQSRVLEELCIREGIPYQLVGGIKFYERREIKDLLSYLRFIGNPFDKLSFDRIINLPPRGIGKVALEKFYNFHKRNFNSNFLESLAGLKEIQDLQKAALAGFHSFYQLMKDLKEKSTKIPFVDFFDLVLEKNNFISYIRDGSEEGEERFQNILELRNVINEYSEIDPKVALRKFLEEIALLTDVDRMEPNTNQITLITMHAVKGLEFPIVFIAGMEEGLFPHSRSFISNTALEEERRLCYVGITRAKKLLYLTRAKERTLYSGPQYTMPSRFIADIPSELLLDLNGKNQWSSKKQAPKTKITNNNELYNEGDKVMHEKFGQGVIVQAKGEEIAVAFEGFGIKRLLSSIAPLKKVDQ